MENVGKEHAKAYSTNSVRRNHVRRLIGPSIQFGLNYFLCILIGIGLCLVLKYFEVILFIQHSLYIFEKKWSELRVRGVLAFLMMLFLKNAQISSLASGVLKLTVLFVANC